MKKLPENFVVSPDREAKQLMMLHGVPASVLRPFKINLRQHLRAIDISLNPEKPNLVSRRIQKQWFSGLQQTLPLKPMIVVFSSYLDYQKARQAASIVFYEYLQKAIASNTAKPEWLFMQSWQNHKLLEDIANGLYKKPQLLVLDNIHENMSQMGFAATVDIIQLLCNRPIFLLVNSFKPHQIALKLGVKPSMIFHFAGSIPNYNYRNKQ